jgi:hypothetical protein
MERLGLGPDVAFGRNRKLVYGRMTGWGQTGPYAQQPGHDINFIAITGALHAIGTPAQPVIPANLVGDFGGGALYLAFGVMAALRHAERTGEGQVIDCAMSDGAIWRAARGATLAARTSSTGGRISITSMSAPTATGLRSVRLSRPSTRLSLPKPGSIRRYSYRSWTRPPGPRKENSSRPSLHSGLAMNGAHCSKTRSAASRL